MQIMSDGVLCILKIQSSTHASDRNSFSHWCNAQVPFLLLGLDLPATPLFQDNMERNAIPQVHLNVIMQKFDGTTVDDNVKTGRRRFSVLKLPRYLILHMKRFYKNNFFIEKNPTIVNFPVKNWEVKEAIPVPSLKPDGPPQPSKYNLVANVCHDGKAGEGVYRCHINRAAEDMWYENQDLSVVEVLPQMVALSEAYLQVTKICSAAVFRWSHCCCIMDKCHFFTEILHAPDAHKQVYELQKQS